MPDAFTKTKRSEVMSLIRPAGSRATKLEGDLEFWILDCCTTKNTKGGKDHG